MLQLIQHVFPADENIFCDLGEIATGIVSHGGLQIGSLNRHRRRRATPRKFERLLHAQIAGNLLEASDRIVQLELRQISTGVEKVQDNGQRADLEVGRQFRHIGIADNHVQAPILAIVRMRFIA